MDRTMLRDDQWARIEQLLPGKKSDPGCTAKDNRRFVEGVLHAESLGGIVHQLIRALGARLGDGEAVAAALSEVKQSRSRFRNLAVTRSSAPVSGSKNGETDTLTEE